MTLEKVAAWLEAIRSELHSPNPDVGLLRELLHGLLIDFNEYHREHKD